MQYLNTPQPKTRLHAMETPISNSAIMYTPSTTADKRPLEEAKDVNNTPSKKPRVVTPQTPESEELADQENGPSKKEQQRIKRELEREEREKKKVMEREKKKEEERVEKERKRLERERKKEQERLERERKKEAEKLLRERRKEEERLERERRKEEERLERELKKEEERLERERKKEEERLEREKKKEEERLEREKKKEEKEEEKRRQEQQGHRQISAFFAKNKNHTVLPKKDQTQLYQKTFLPFYQKSTTVFKLPQLPAHKLKESVATFDRLLKELPSLTIKPVAAGAAPVSSAKISTNKILEALNSPDSTEEKIIGMLKLLPPIKYLQFYENAKPPYIGTWCSDQNLALKFPILDPFNQDKTGFDYNYDSDLDWNGEDEEGEDIDELEDEEDDDEDDMDSDEMEDFVEGAEDKSRKFIGTLVPVCQWGSIPELKYEKLLVSVQFAIDPFGPVEVEEKENKGKPMIKDAEDLQELTKFIEQNNQFTISTMTEVARLQPRFAKYTKAMVKSSVLQLAQYNKSTGKWEVPARP